MKTVCVSGLLLGICLGFSSIARAGSDVDNGRPHCTAVVRADGKTLREKDRGQLEAIRSAMEDLRGKLEEWGMVTASVPLVMVSQGQFKIDSNPANFFTPKEYITYEQTNVSGSSLQSTESALTNQLSASGKGQFQTNAATGLKEPILGPATDLDTSKLSAPSSLSITNNVSADRFATPGSLAPTLSGNPGRAAVLLGMNDKLTERILAVAADPPAETFVNKDFQVNFAIVEVSCNPGWRTRENYIADLTANCEYYNSTTSKAMPDRCNNTPVVFSVLPLLDAQNLELGNSAHQLTGLATQLSAAYPTIGVTLLGQDLLTFVHRYQKDSLTRTPVTVTNSYSNGRSFGFRFAPSFTAQADPAYRKSRAANILNPTAFPVLVTVIVKPALFLPGPNGQAPEYNAVRVNVSTQWLIKDRPALPVFYKRLYTPMRRDTIDLRYKWAASVATLARFIDETDDATNGPVSDKEQGMDLRADPLLNTMRTRAVELASKCGPQTTIIRMTAERPYDSGVEITSFSPRFVPKTDAFSMILSGPGLDRTTRVVLGGKACTSVSILGRNPQTKVVMILAAFPQGNVVSSDESVVELELATDRNFTLAAADKPMLLKADRAITQGKTDATLTLQRDGNGLITTINLDRSKLPSLTDQQVMEAFSSIIQQGGGTAKSAPGATPAPKGIPAPTPPTGGPTLDPGVPSTK
jgi:hypothetical protein